MTITEEQGPSGSLPLQLQRIPWGPRAAADLPVGAGAGRGGRGRGQRHGHGVHHKTKGTGLVLALHHSCKGSTF